MYLYLYSINKFFCKHLKIEDILIDIEYVVLDVLI